MEGCWECVWGEEALGGILWVNFASNIIKNINLNNKIVIKIKHEPQSKNRQEVRPCYGQSQSL